MASIMDKMTMVLAGTISQEILDRESLSIAGDKKIQTPFLIIKVFRKHGVLKAAIYMPKYEESIVTGQKTVVGKRKVGDLVTTQVEPSISSGNLYVDPGLAGDPALLEQKVIAVPYIFAMGIGAHVSMLFRFPKHITFAEFSYTWPLFGYGSGIRGGALLGFDMDVDFRFAAVPILQAEVSFFFEKKN